MHAGDGGVVINTQTYTGATILYGGAGDDHLLAGSSNDQLYGFAGDDTLDAGDGNDWLLGASGRDSLVGGNGNDVLRGQGFSGDRLIGGPGIDLHGRRCGCRYHHPRRETTSWFRRQSGHHHRRTERRLRRVRRLDRRCLIIPCPGSLTAGYLSVVEPDRGGGLVGF